MRVLFFIPAFLVASGFVAAVPVASPGPSDAMPHSCLGSGGDNDAALQPIISIIANATIVLQPLSDQLSTFTAFVF